MHVSLHPNQWFHHETLPGGARLRQLLRDGAFWAVVVLIAMLGAALALALLVGGTIGNDPYTTFYVP